MKRFSTNLASEIYQAVQTAFHMKSVMNVSSLAETIRRRNVLENVAYEDIERELLMQGQLLGVAMEFDRDMIERDGFASASVGLQSEILVPKFAS